MNHKLRSRDVETKRLSSFEPNTVVAIEQMFWVHFSLQAHQSCIVIAAPITLLPARHVVGALREIGVGAECVVAVNVVREERCHEVKERGVQVRS